MKSEERPERMGRSEKKGGREGKEGAERERGRKVGEDKRSKDGV